MSKANVIQKITYLGDFVVASFLLIVLRNPYEWMEEADLGITHLPEDPSRDIRILMTLTPLLVITGMHLVSIIINKGLAQRTKNAAIVCALFGYWFWKFFYPGTSS